MAATKSYLPTKKWWTALVTGAAAILVNYIESGVFDEAERGAAVTLAVALVGSYIKSNDATSEGVPVK